MVDTTRQTGRTRRAIEECRRAAERGEKRAYACGHVALKRYCIAMFDWSGWDRKDGGFRFIHPGGGEVWFISARNRQDIDDWGRGRSHSMVFDHAYGSLAR